MVKDLNFIVSCVSALSSAASAVFAFLAWRQCRMRGIYRFSMNVESDVDASGKRTVYLDVVNRSEVPVQITHIGFVLCRFGRVVEFSHQTMYDDMQPGATSSFCASEAFAAVKQHPFASVRPFVRTSDGKLHRGQKLRREQLRPAGE